MAAFRKNPEAMLEKDMERYPSFSEEQLKEISDYVGENYIITEATSELTKRNPYVIKNSLKNDINSARFLDEIERILYGETGKTLFYEDIGKIIKSVGIEYSANLPNLLRTYYPEADRIRRRPRLFAKNEQEIEEAITERNFLLRPDDPDILRQNPKLVIATLEKNFDFIEHVSPCISLTKDEKNAIITMALKNNYILNKDSLYALKESPEILMQSIKENIKNIEFAKKSIKLSEEQKEEIRELLLSTEPAILLNDKTINELKNDSKYIMESLNRASDTELQQVVDNIDFKNIKPEIFFKVLERDITQIKKVKDKMLSLSQQEQEQIYNYYLEQKDKIRVNEEIEEVMMQNSFYVMSYAKEDIEHIDEISFSGLKLTEEFKEEIGKQLLENGYKVTKDTPKFIRNNHEFVYNYIKQNNGQLNGLNLNEVLPLFTLKEIEKNPKYKEIYSLSEGKVTPLSSYINAWGAEITFELTEKFGDYIKFLDKNTDYTIEKAKLDLTNLIKNGARMSIDETIGLISRLKLRLTKEDFEGSPNLKYNDKLFEKILPDFPELIEFYEGNNDEILGLVIDSITEEQIKKKINLQKSSLIMKNAINKGNLEYIKYYIGVDESLFEEAIKHGLFSEKSDEEIHGLLRATNTMGISPTIINYLIETKGPDWIYDYRGNDEKIFKEAIKCGLFLEKSDEEIHELLKEKHFMSTSPTIINYLIETKSPDWIFDYTGIDEKVFEEATKHGLFLEKSDEEIHELLKENHFMNISPTIINYLIETKGPNWITEYKGNNTEVFENAIKLGYKITLKEFIENPKLIENDFIINEGAKNDPKILALKLYRTTDLSERKNIIKSIIGEEQYKLIASDEKKEKNILNVCDIIVNSPDGLLFMKTLNAELIEKLGFEKWKILVKYAIHNPNLNDLIEIKSNKELDSFYDAYGQISYIIQDKSVFEINKLLKIAHFYNQQPTFCKELTEKMKKGYNLSEIEETSLYMLIYKNFEKTDKNLTVENLKDTLLDERDRYIANLDNHSVDVKNDLFKFLINMDLEEVEQILKKNINSRTVTQIYNRAQKENNQKLELEAKYMGILVDVIEKIYYQDLTQDQLKEYARKIYNQDIQEVSKIRREFCDIKELIRNFYEIEAQEELTDVQALLKNKENYEEYKTEAGKTFKIVDLSKSKHTIYAHCLGEKVTVDYLFDTDRGFVTICLSTETDKHEAYYHSGESRTIGYTKIPIGSYVGSSVRNMGSSSYLQENDHRTNGVEEQFNQQSIRNLYTESGHSETLVYRAGLIPTCVIMNKDTPSETEICLVEELQEKIKEVTGEEVEIPLVRTQHQKNRVVRYQQYLSGEKIIKEFETEDARLDMLREKFDTMFGHIKEEHLMRGDYTIINGEIYKTYQKGEKELEAEKTAMELQKLIYGENSPNVLDIREIKTKSLGEEKEVVAIKEVDARSMWNYKRENGAFSPKANSILLKEFLIDHLMCNYNSDNEAFLLDTDERIYGINKEKALDAVDDFITDKGDIYTNMTYFYFNDEKGNNIYRKVFENYINNNDETQIFSEKDFEEFEEIAMEISSMDNDEYMQMFKGLIEQLPEEKREKAEKLILARKETVAVEARNFTSSLINARKIQQEPEVFENPESIAFINDIHGNLEALKTILEDCERNGRTDVFVLGDLIGFGPQSNECLDLIRESSKKLNIRCILGNHELYSLMGDKNFGNTAGFQPGLTDEIRKEMSKENRVFIETLPLERKIVIGDKKVELTHYPTRRNFENDSEIYISHGGNVLDSEMGLTQDYLIYGHEHRTEATTGDEVGTIGNISNCDTVYMNLPSSGCVHGRRTSYVTVKLEDGKLIPDLEVIEYNQDKVKEAFKERKNSNQHYFGLRGDDENERR